MWPERANRPPELANRWRRPDIITSFHCRVRQRAGWDMGGARNKRRDATPGRESLREPRGGDLDPDQRVRVFISRRWASPQAQRNRCATNPAASRSRRRWHNWPAIPGTGIWASRYVVCSLDELQTHRACRPHRKICGGQATSRASPQTQPAAISQRRRHPRWSMALRTPAGPCSKAWLHPTRPNAACVSGHRGPGWCRHWCQLPDDRGAQA